MSILFQLVASNPAGPERVTDELDLDRHWHLLHYLVTGHADPHADGSPLADAIFGGTFRDGDDETRILTPPEVARVAGAFGAVDEGTVRQRFDPSVYRRLAIYDAHAWNRDQVDHAVSLIDDLETFYRDAARRGDRVAIDCEGVDRGFSPSSAADAIQRFQKSIRSERRPRRQPPPHQLADIALGDLPAHPYATPPSEATGSLDLSLDKDLMAIARLPFFRDLEARVFLVFHASELPTDLPDSKIDAVQVGTAWVFGPRRQGWKMLDDLRALASTLAAWDASYSLEVRSASEEAAARHAYAGNTEKGRWQLKSWAPGIGQDSLQQAVALARDTEAGLLPRCASEEEERFLVKACGEDPGFGPIFDFRIEDQRLHLARKPWPTFMPGPPPPPHVLAHFTAKLLLERRLGA